MRIKWGNVLLVGTVGGLFLWNAFGESLLEQYYAATLEPVDPDWAAIAVWPGQEADVVEAQPDPNRRITVIVLDDSGSMGEDIEPAKAAVASAIAAMADTDRVAVLALNRGSVMPFEDADAARAAVTDALRPIRSNGGTPLTRSLQSASDLLAQEAARFRGFGTYRVIITTDGAANDDRALERAIQQLAAQTPIQVTTIGIGLSGRHVLSRSDLGSYVDVANIGALEAALQDAVAENTDFTAITEFGG